MKSKTQTGLLLLLIATGISLITTVVTYVTYAISSPFDTVGGSLSSVIATIPISILGFISGILILIGSILFLVGRKEFGEKHQQYIKYALFAVVGIIIITVITTILIAGLVFTAVSSSFSGDFTSGDYSSIADDFLTSGFLNIFFILAIVQAAIGGLVWVFGLYQLENDFGKRLLVGFYLISIVIAIVSVWNAQTMISDIFETAFSDGTSSSDVSQYLSNYMWVGVTGLITLVGTLLSNGLLLGALYIPYKRIKSGELVPTLQESTVTTGTSHDRICPNCQKAIPFDAEICPYCGKHFQMY